MPLTPFVRPFTLVCVCVCLQLGQQRCRSGSDGLTFGVTAANLVPVSWNRQLSSLSNSNNNAARRSCSAKGVPSGRKPASVAQ